MPRSDKPKSRPPLPTIDDIRRVAEEIDDCADVTEYTDGPMYALSVTVGSLIIEATSDYRSSSLIAMYAALQAVRDEDHE